MCEYKIMSAITLHKETNGSFSLEFDSPEIPTQELEDMYSAINDGKEVYANGGRYSKESTPRFAPEGRYYNFGFKVNSVTARNDTKPSFNITLIFQGYSESVVK